MNTLKRATIDEIELSGNGNGHAMAPSAATEIGMTRAAQEVQAAMVIAKRFPRDQNAAYTAIIQACKRPSLAERAQYSYSRGGTEIIGPSIRLAEALAMNWGNIDFGVVELEQRDGESSIMAYAWDLETNTRQTKIFTVPHERHTKRGVSNLTDPRDIYELVANQGARRLRACILGVIPGDVVDAAMDQCTQTLSGQHATPLADRLRSMLVAFAEMGVTQEMVETKLGHTLASTSEHEMVSLRRAFAAIRDGVASVEQHFTKPGSKTAAPLNAVPETPPSAGPEQTEDAPPQPAPSNPQPAQPPPASASGPAEGEVSDEQLADMVPAEFLRLLRDKAKDNGLAGKPAFEGGLFKYARSLDLGDIGKLAPNARGELYRAVCAKRFDWTTGVIL